MAKASGDRLLVGLRPSKSLRRISRCPSRDQGDLVAGMTSHHWKLGSLRVKK
jgi:hypothetical protein